MKPPALTDRDKELEHLRSIITPVSKGGTERHVLITGLRGVGKTVLLNEFEAMCTEAGWYADTKEMGRTTPLITLVMRVARTALLNMDAKKRAGDRVRSALRALKSFELTFGGVASLKIEVDAAPGVADSGILAEDLRDLVVAVGQAAEEAGLGFPLILDELQNAAKEEYEALIIALHRAKQKALPVVFVGGGLPLLPALTTEAKSYAERMFIFPKIGGLLRPRRAPPSYFRPSAKASIGTRTPFGACSNSPTATRSSFKSTVGGCGAKTTIRRSRSTRSRQRGQWSRPTSTRSSMRTGSAS